MIDWTTVIAAALGAIGSYLGNMASQRRREQEQALVAAEREARQEERMKALEDRMGRIEKKLDEHNHYAEKLGSVEKSMAGMQRDIEYLRKEQK